MTLTERRKYLARMQPRYLLADRPTRGQLLDEMMAVTGLHRKSLLRLLNAPSLARRPRTTPRARTYGAAVEDALRLIWETLDYLCAERLTPVLVATCSTYFGHPFLSQLVCSLSSYIPVLVMQTCGGSTTAAFRSVTPSAVPQFA